MSKENARNFYTALKDNETAVKELRGKLDEANPQNRDAAANIVISYAYSKGYDFTAEELKNFESEAQAEAKESLSSEDTENDSDTNYGLSCLLLGVGWGHAGLAVCRILGAGFGEG